MSSGRTFAQHAARPSASTLAFLRGPEELLSLDPKASRTAWGRDLGPFESQPLRIVVTRPTREDTEIKMFVVVMRHAWPPVLAHVLTTVRGEPARIDVYLAKPEEDLAETLAGQLVLPLF